MAACRGRRSIHGRRAPHRGLRPQRRWCSPAGGALEPRENVAEHPVGGIDAGVIPGDVVREVRGARREDRARPDAPHVRAYDLHPRRVACRHREAQRAAVVELHVAAGSIVGIVHEEVGRSSRSAIRLVGVVEVDPGQKGCAPFPPDPLQGVLGGRLEGFVQPKGLVDLIEALLKDVGVAVQGAAGDESRGVIAPLLQDLGQREMRIVEPLPRGHAHDSRSVRILSGQQGGEGRRRLGPRRDRVLVDDCLGGHALEVRGGPSRVAVETHVVCADRAEADDEDVGRTGHRVGRAIRSMRAGAAETEQAEGRNTSDVSGRPGPPTRDRPFASRRRLPSSQDRLPRAVRAHRKRPKGWARNAGPDRSCGKRRRRFPAAAGELRAPSRHGPGPG